MIRRKAVPAWAVLALLVALSTALRTLASHGVRGPWISPDETVYALLGQSLYRHGSLAILGGPTPFYSLVVPLVVGPLLSLHNLALGYSLLKPALALAMSLAAVPVYLWARELAGRSWALVAAALTLALPGLAYSGLVMSEVAFYPVFTLAAWATARAIAEPSPRRIAWLAAAVTLALVTRLQALVLVPVLVAAVVLDAIFARSLQRALRTSRVLVSVAAPLIAWLLVQQLRGEPLLGACASVAGTTYRAQDAVRFVLYHAGALVLTTGVLPACALLALGARAALRGERDPLRRATVATTLARAGGIVVQVGVFASQHVGQIAERDMLCVAPSLLVCFVLALRGNATIGRLVAGGAALVAFGAVAALPLGDLVTANALPDALTFAPLWQLETATSARVLTTIVLVATACVGLLFVFVRRPRILIGILFVAAVGGSVSASREVVTQSQATRAALLGPAPRWVDDAANGRSATYVYDGNHDWPAVWQTLFWNRSIGHVVTVDRALLPGPAPQRDIGPPQDGRIDVQDALLVLPTSFTIAGSPLAEAAQSIPGQTGLRVWNLAPPPRIVSRAIGLQSNGDIYGNEHATLTAYGCTNGTWTLTLIPKGAQTVVLEQDGKPLRTLHVVNGDLKAGFFLNLELPVLPHSGTTCTLDVRPTYVLGTTRFAYVPG
jgi:hypothetical protein